MLDCNNCSTSSPLVLELICGGSQDTMDFDACDRIAHGNNLQILSQSCSCCGCCCRSAPTKNGLLEQADCSSISSMSTCEASMEDEIFPGEESMITLRDHAPGSFTFEGAMEQPFVPQSSSTTVVSRDSPISSILVDESDFFEESGDDCMSMGSCSSGKIGDLVMAHSSSFFRLPFLSYTMPPERPFSNMPDEMICNIASFLDVLTLAQSFGKICSRFQELSTRNEAGWEDHCTSLWSAKAHVPKWARLMLARRRAFCAYRLSLHDSVRRQEIEEDELCFDPRSGTGFVWDFRFKENAGPQWTQFDPWFSGGKARKMVFLKNGRVQQLESGKQQGTYTLSPPFSTVLDLDGNEAPASLDFKWRFMARPMDLPDRPIGAYIRLTVDGRDVPTYVVHRSPTGDWGFVMESCWGVYSSTTLPSKEQIRSIPTHPRRRSRMRLRRTRNGGRWFDVDGLETESEDESLSPLSLEDDDSFSVSTRRQWREALLYNSGCSRLPEGDGAAAEFDRVWNQTFRTLRRTNI